MSGLDQGCHHDNIWKTELSKSVEEAFPIMGKIQRKEKVSESFCVA